MASLRKCAIETVNQIVSTLMATGSSLMGFASFFLSKLCSFSYTVISLCNFAKEIPIPRSFHLWCLPLWTRSPCPYWARMWYGSYCWDETGRGFAAQCNFVPGQVSTCRWIHGWNSLLWLQDVEKTEPFLKKDKEGCNTTVFDVSLTFLPALFLWLLSRLGVA